MKVILLFLGAEDKPAWGKDTWGQGLGPGEDITVFEDLCMKDHTQGPLPFLESCEVILSAFIEKRR